MPVKTSALDVKRARVVVEIDGEEMTLIPSPSAILSLSAQFGGFQPLVGAIGRLDIQAMVSVVVAGLGLEGRAARDMADAVAMSSGLEMAPKLIEFAMILANGGKPLKADKGDEDEGKRPS
jgi:hypothetical protein